MLETTTLELCVELYEKYGVTTVYDPDSRLIIHGKDEKSPSANGLTETTSLNIIA